MPRLPRTFRIAFQLALQSIRSNPGRSAIICFSLFLGVASVLIMMGILRAMDSELQKEIEGNGGITTIHVNERRPESNEEIRTFGMSPGLRNDHMERIMREIPGISFYIPRGWPRAPINYGTSALPLDYTSIATNSHYCDRYLKNRLVEGRLFTQKEYEEAAPVCLIGGELKETLMGKLPWRGKRIMIGGVPVEVIGILVWNRGGPYIPLTLSWKYFESVNTPIRKCEFVAEHVEDVPRIRKEIETLLLQLHRGIRDFDVETTLDFQQQMMERMALTKLIIMVIGSLALLLGSIGIVNVFLSILNDQIRLLGMQKALGGTDLDLFAQQLVEALLLALVGGGLGTLGGSLLSKLPFLPWPGLLLIPDYLRAVGIACGVGILAGLLPAIKASRMTPASAMRVNG